MPRKTPKNFKRPERVTHVAEVVQDAKPVAEVLKTLPAHFTESIRANTKLKPCCREISNLTFHTEKSDPSMEKPNKGVFTCSTCGAKHIRFMQGGGKFGG